MNEKSQPSESIIVMNIFIGDAKKLQELCDLFDQDATREVSDRLKISHLRVSYSFVLTTRELFSPVRSNRPLRKTKKTIFFDQSDLTDVTSKQGGHCDAFLCYWMHL